MIKSLDETIKTLILKKGGFKNSEVDIRFDQPTTKSKTNTLFCGACWWLSPPHSSCPRNCSRVS
jgi:hypothetical protein